jgi:uncharacterized protein YcbK (DUF882 family)
MQPRRNFLKSASAFALTALCLPAWADAEPGASFDANNGDNAAPETVDPTLATQAPAPSPATGVRSLAFENLHTREKLALDYWRDGEYIEAALRRIDHHLRDFRTGEVHAIDTRLLDLLNALHAKLGTDKPFQVLSGYRSARTNAMLYAKTEGVNPKSLHMSGMAIDICVIDRSVIELAEAARALGSGGVGLYPRFVHVDVGAVQWWTFTPETRVAQR